MTNKKKKSAKSKKKQKINFSLTWSGLFSTTALAILALVWAFILGVLVGRGYKPEYFLPQLSKILPHKEDQQVKTVTKPEDQVLKPEELGFFGALQEGWTGIVGPEHERKNFQTRQEQPKTSVEREEKSSLKETYRYTYQVAAFRSLNKAKKLRGQLRSSGMNSDIQMVNKRGVRWFRVFASFKGHPDQTQNFLKNLRKSGIKKPFLRSKKRL